MSTRAIRHSFIVPASLAALAVGAVIAVLVATAQAEHGGPFVGIDRAHDAADKASDRAHAEDAQAATLGADTAPANEDAAADDDDSAANDATESAPAPEGPPAAAGGNDDGRPHVVGVDPVAKPVALGQKITYDPTQHRDPFRAPSLTTTQVVDNAPRTPLERYELGQLKLVGIVTETGSARAMVEDAAGLGYIVTTGTPIGSSGGVVTSIEPRRVLIEEHVTNFYGDKEPKQIVMELPKEDRSP